MLELVDIQHITVTAFSRSFQWYSCHFLTRISSRANEFFHLPLAHCSQDLLLAKQTETKGQGAKDCLGARAKPYTSLCSTYTRQKTEIPKKCYVQKLESL